LEPQKVTNDKQAETEQESSAGKRAMMVVIVAGRRKIASVLLQKRFQEAVFRDLYSAFTLGNAAEGVSFLLTKVFNT